MKTRVILAVFLMAAAVSGCGTVKEKTAPCRRPSAMTSYAETSDAEMSPAETSGTGDGDLCGPMRPVNDPETVFRAIGIADPAGPRDGVDE